MKARAILLIALAATPALAQDKPSWSPETFYKSRCAFCHDAGGWGTRSLAKRLPEGEAELTKHKVLPADYVRYVVRNGIGSMPQFTPTELTDEQLAELAAWLERPKPARR